MSLQLSTRDLELLDRAQRVLLAPLEQPDTSSWLNEASQSIGNLIGTDRASALLQAGEYGQYVRSDIDAGAISTYMSYYSALDFGYERMVRRQIRLRINR